MTRHRHRRTDRTTDRTRGHRLATAALTAALAAGGVAGGLAVTVVQPATAAQSSRCTQLHQAARADAVRADDAYARYKKTHSKKDLQRAEDYRAKSDAEYKQYAASC